MFGLLRRPPAHRGGLRGRVVLRLEGFEDRVQPSSPVAVGDMGQTRPPANQKPVIVDFEARAIGRGWFLITGRVIDEDAGGLVVTLGGTTSAAGRTVTTAADGTFSLTVSLRTGGSDVGWITATTVDHQGLVSDEVSDFVDP
jgi:hypothetical protein